MAKPNKQKSAVRIWWLCEALLPHSKPHKKHPLQVDEPDDELACGLSSKSFGDTPYRPVR